MRARVGPGRGSLAGREEELKFLARPLDRSAWFEAIEGVIPEKHAFSVGKRLVCWANVIFIYRYENFHSPQAWELEVHRT